MSHQLQERYSSLVDKKLRAGLVTKDQVIFNTRYEGSPKAGSVKIPVRDGEVTVGDYTINTGMDINVGSTSYITVTDFKQKAVNELIDGYESAAVPDNLVADRLDSAGYSLGLVIDKDAIAELEGSGTKVPTYTTLTASNIFGAIVDAGVALDVANVPTEGRWLIVSPTTYALLLKDADNFIKKGDLSQEIVQSGAVGGVAGFNVYKSNNATADFIAGHPDWCVRIEEWSVDVKLQDLSGSGKYIGASAVQGRKVYQHKVTKAAAVYVYADEDEE